MRVRHTGPAGPRAAERGGAERDEAKGEEGVDDHAVIVRAAALFTPGAVIVE